MDTENIIREIDVWIDDFTPCLKDNLTGEWRRCMPLTWAFFILISSVCLKMKCKKS